MENFKRTGKWYYDIWENGKYLDLWSANHTLAGCVIAGPLYYLSVPFAYSFLIALILMVGWEVYEVIYDIKETWQNRSLDIITGTIGFMAIWIPYPYWDDSTQLLVYVAALSIWLILEGWGYIAYKATHRALQ